MRRTISQQNTLKELIANQYSKEADCFLSFKCMTFLNTFFAFSRVNMTCVDYLQFARDCGYDFA